MWLTVCAITRQHQQATRAVEYFKQLIKSQPDNPPEIEIAPAGRGLCVIHRLRRN